MASTKFSVFTRLIFSLIFFLNTSVCFSNVESNERISVTDFKYFRKITYKNQQLLIYRNQQLKNIFYNTDNLNLSSINTKDQTEFNLNIKSKNSNHEISYQNQQVSYFAKTKAISFADSNYASKNSICDQKLLDESILRLDSKSVMRGIGSLNLESQFDETCNAEQKQKMNLYLGDLLRAENSLLTKCNSNDSIQKMKLADPKYLTYTSKVYAKYLRLVDKINDGSTPIKISCKMNSATKYGSFDEKENKISFNWEQLIKNSNSEKELSESVRKILGHELFHYGEQVKPDNEKTNLQCLNEKYAQTFTDLCDVTRVAQEVKYTIGTSSKEKIDLKIPTSNELELLCSSESAKSALDSEFGKVVLKNDKLKNETASKNEGGGKVEGALKVSQSQAQIQQTKAVSQELTKTVSQSDFVKPSNQDFAVLLSKTSALSKENKPYTVSANSDFGKVVAKTLSSFNTSGTVLTNKLNSALAAVASTPAQAKAQTSTLAKFNTIAKPEAASDLKAVVDTKIASMNSNSRGPASAADTPAKSDVKPTSQPTSAAVSKTNTNTGTGTNAASASRMPAAIDKTVNVNSQQKNDLATSANPVTNTSTTSSIGNDSRGNLPNKINSANFNSANQNSAPQNGKNLVKSIQSLKAFTSLTGAQYAEIRKSYDDPKFKNLLSAYDIRIVVKNSAGQYQALGVDSQNAKKIFTDDGQNLKVIDEKSKK